MIFCFLHIQLLFTVKSMKNVQLVMIFMSNFGLVSLSLFFLNGYTRDMGGPEPGVESELQLECMQQPQQHWV